MSHRFSYLLCLCPTTNTQFSPYESLCDDGFDLGSFGLNGCDIGGIMTSDCQKNDQYADCVWPPSPNPPPPRIRVGIGIGIEHPIRLGRHDASIRPIRPIVPIVPIGSSPPLPTPLAPLIFPLFRGVPEGAGFRPP